MASKVSRNGLPTGPGQLNKLNESKQRSPQATTAYQRRQAKRAAARGDYTPEELRVANMIKLTQGQRKAGKTPLVVAQEKGLVSVDPARFAPERKVVNGREFNKPRRSNNRGPNRKQRREIQRLKQKEIDLENKLIEMAEVYERREAVPKGPVVRSGEWVSSEYSDAVSTLEQTEAPMYCPKCDAKQFCLSYPTEDLPGNLYCYRCFTDSKWGQLSVQGRSQRLITRPSEMPLDDGTIVEMVDALEADRPDPLASTTFLPPIELNTDAGEKVLAEKDDDLESNVSTISKSARRRARRKRAKIAKGGIVDEPMISVLGNDPRELDCIPEEIPEDEPGPAPKPDQPKKDRPEQLKERDDSNRPFRTGEEFRPAVPKLSRRLRKAAAKGTHVTDPDLTAYLYSYAFCRKRGPNFVPELVRRANAWLKQNRPGWSESDYHTAMTDAVTTVMQPNTAEENLMALLSEKKVNRRLHQMAQISSGVVGKKFNWKWVLNPIEQKFFSPITLPE